MLIGVTVGTEHVTVPHVSWLRPRRLRRRCLIKTVSAVLMQRLRAKTADGDALRAGAAVADPVQRAYLVAEYAEASGWSRSSCAA
ncbi:hypothetical protein [Streptomyces sp. KL116D]|uniref:hypothetical protein n=1 Tax=Streptomyces sp. KL116D TaxID=3045152 RepID=UPI003557525D